MITSVGYGDCLGLNVYRSIDYILVGSSSSRFVRYKMEKRERERVTEVHKLELKRHSCDDAGTTWEEVSTHEVLKDTALA